MIRGGALQATSNQRLRKSTQWCGAFERRCNLLRHSLSIKGDARLKSRHSLLVSLGVHIVRDL